MPLVLSLGSGMFFGFSVMRKITRKLWCVLLVSFQNLPSSNMERSKCRVRLILEGAPPKRWSRNISKKQK